MLTKIKGGKMNISVNDNVLLKLFLEREKLKTILLEIKEDLKQLYNRYINIGAPFNDNTLNFNRKQLEYLAFNKSIIEDIIYEIEKEEEND